jgi:hypothetical protein
MQHPLEAEYEIFAKNYRIVAGTFDDRCGTFVMYA